MTLQEEFHDELMEMYRKVKRECKYNATRFIQMVKEKGGYQTAKELIASNDVSEGFVTLFAMGRKDLTVEALVIKEKYKTLFTDAEIKKCKEKLGIK